MKIPTLAAALAASAMLVAHKADAQVVQSNASFAVSLNVLGGCSIFAPDSSDIVRRIMPDVTCPGNEGYSVGRLASGGSVDADGTPVMAIANGQADVQSVQMTGAPASDDSVWLVSF